MTVAASAKVEIPAASDCVDAVNVNASDAFTNASEEIRGSVTWMAPRTPNKITAERRNPLAGAEDPGAEIGVDAGEVVDMVPPLALTAPGHV